MTERTRTNKRIKMYKNTEVHEMNSGVFVTCKVYSPTVALQWSMRWSARQSSAIATIQSIQCVVYAVFLQCRTISSVFRSQFFWQVFRCFRSASLCTEICAPPMMIQVIHVKVPLHPHSSSVSHWRPGQFTCTCAADAHRCTKSCAGPKIWAARVPWWWCISDGVMV